MVFNWKKEILYFITDQTIQSRFSHGELAEMAIEGGANLIQFRHKPEATTAELIEMAGEVKVICKKNGVPLVVNDRVDVAMAIEADGVHLGQDDLHISVARRMMPKNSIFGLSARTPEAISEAIELEPDYIGFGPIFPTSSKPELTPRGLDRLREVCKLLKIPVIAIGGINAENASEVMKCGASGVAVISAIAASDDIVSATAQLTSSLSSIDLLISPAK